MQNNPKYAYTVFLEVSYKKKVLQILSNAQPTKENRYGVENLEIFKFV